MRIVYLCADRGVPLGGRKGASAHARGLIRAFRDGGHEVVTLSTSAEDVPRDGARVVTPAQVAKGIEDACERRLARALGHVWTNVAAERALDELARQWRPDLVYERYGPFGVAGGIVARALGVAHLLEVNAPLAREGATWRHQAIPEVASALERAAFANAGHIVVVSEALRAELVHSGVDPERIAVVPNGVDLRLFAPRGTRRGVGPPGSVVIGFVGGLRPWHAVDDLARAFRELAVDPRVHLLVVGDGALGRELESLERELPGRVTWLRAVEHEEVPACVRAMDVAVAPYPPLERFYFSPLKVLEYMASGRPVVASRIGQLEELVEDGETGLLAPPGDVAALTAAIRRLLGDASLRARLGARAAARASESHGWGDRAERILALVPGAAAPEAA